MVEEAEDFARDGMPKLRAFIDNPDAQESEKARTILSVLTTYASLRATRAREASVMVSMARQMGLRGEALQPMFEKLSGRSATAFLPEKTQE